MDRKRTPAASFTRQHARALLLAGVLGGLARSPAPAQEVRAVKQDESRVSTADASTTAPAKVDVDPIAEDEEIAARLQRILEATAWFTEPIVRVQEGVAFLEGETETEQLKRWAGDLARNTQDVVAVVNRMTVAEPSAWDFAPAWAGVKELWRDFVRSLPLVVFALLILALSAFAGVLAARRARSFFRERIAARLLRNVIAIAIGFLVFLVGTYIVLRVSGLTQLAFTVLGGTGLIGLIIGIAFRDITENFLASIFLSMQRPFEPGDLVEIDQITGYVQQLNIRTTMLMTLDGNVVQIPNSTVYKKNILNFTTNANRRESFVIGIGYDDPIIKAQEVALAVLDQHPAVLRDPEPWVLADSLSSSTVNLRVYFWLNGREHSWLKVRSAVIRLVKRAFQENGISMPDDAREVVFPRGVPVRILQQPEESTPGEEATQAVQKDTDAASTQGEAGLLSEAAVIETQARQAPLLTEAEDLLKK